MDDQTSTPEEHAMTRIARAARSAVGRLLQRRTRYQPRHAARSTQAPYCADDSADRALVAAMNAGRWTALEYLHAIGFPEAERYASAYGRKAAETYRSTHGAEPYSACAAIVRGRIRLVFGYADIADMQAAAWEYKRTREHLNARRAEALAGLAA